MNYPCYKLVKKLEKLKKINNFKWSKNPITVEILLEHFNNNIDYCGLCLNTNQKAIDYLKEHKNCIHWDIISSNFNAIELIKENLDKISWAGLSLNNCAFKLLFENQDKIDWTNICFNNNPKIIRDIIAKNLDKKISWSALSSNNCIEALIILKANKDKIDWSSLSFNSNNEAIDLLLENPEKINWANLSSNENERIIEIFRNNQDKIDWFQLALNYNDENRKIISNTMTNKIKDELTVNNELSIFDYYDYVVHSNYSHCNYEDYLHKLWLNCHSNDIYKVDYEKMRKNFEPMAEEIIKEALHPKRVCKWIESGYDLEDLF